MSSPNKVEIHELDPDIIPPITSRFSDPNYNGGCKLVVVGKPGCFAPGTEILMYDGTIKKVEDVVIGDKLMGDDSTVRNVLELCHNTDEMFKVVPKSGESYIVNKQHKLVLKCCGHPSIPEKKGDIIEITVDEYLKKPSWWKERWAVFRTDVKFDHKELDIDPYILGVWLGDGTSKEPEITNIDTEVLDSIQDFCYNNNLILTPKGNSGFTYRIRSEEGVKGSNIFLNSLKEYNLLGNKHIPKDFKINTRENRLQLLAGILDTDGSYDVRGNCFDFVQKSEILTDDVVFLCRSLGFTATKKETIKSCQSKVGTYYRITISGDLNNIPCKILRKQARERICNRDNLVSRFYLESQGEGEYFGFTIDNNHRFLLSTFDVVRNTGKSTLIKSILYAKKHIFPVGMAMSGSEDSNHAYKEIMPSTFVYNEYDEDKITQFIKRQKLASSHLPNPWAVMILDDCTDDPRIFNKPLQQALYKKGRHWKMLYILSLQYAMDVKPVIRTNVDGIFILREPLLKNREALYKNYASIIPDFTTFCELMDQLTNDYCALYIHGATHTNTWQECVFYYKSPLVSKEWKFGCPEYWDFHNARFNPNYKDNVTGY